MATFVIRSSEQTGAAAMSGKKRSWAFSKVNTPSTPVRCRSRARWAASITELDSITSNFRGVIGGDVSDCLTDAGGLDHAL